MLLTFEPVEFEKQTALFKHREGTFEIWYDKTAFPFTVRKFDSLEFDVVTENFSVHLTTDFGAEIVLEFIGIGEHEIDLVEHEALPENERVIKLLIVDDEEAIINLLEKIFLSMGIDDISLAFNGETALQAFKITKPDIIFSDYNMPDMDGLELLRKIRALDYQGTFVVFTGYYDKFMQILKKSEVQPDFVFAKPFRRSDIVHILHSVFPELAGKK